MNNEDQRAYEEALARIATCKREKAKSLDLSGIGLTTLPPEIGQLSALMTLYLANNKLTTLPPEISQLSALTELILYDNPLTTLPAEIGQLRLLRRLDLARNRLRTLPETIGRCANLQGLMLEQNQLTVLPQSLRQIKTLSALFLLGNEALNLPPEVVGEPAESWDTDNARRILDYYFARASGQTRPLNEVKMILVGDGGRGKTETVNRLVGRTFGGATTEETVGINIEDWTLPCDGGDPVTVHVWDFAGQTVTHGLHKFFS
jgi:internalin A